MTTLRIEIKRIYDPLSPNDGFRILVDRIWPRGISKEKASWHEWDKRAAPSLALRTWFSHDPAKWETFKRQYFAELDQTPDTVRHILELAAQGTVTLLYSAHDTQHNQARALREYLLSHAATPLPTERKPDTVQPS